VRDGTGAVTGIVVVATDVTELVEARRISEDARMAAEEANAAKAQFLATMSHELRTPLNAIGGYAQLMEMGVHGSVTTQQREALARIRRSQEHLLGLINNVLNYAKLEAGKVSYEFADLPLRQVLREVEALVAPQARVKKLALELSCSDAGVSVRADAEKLRQVLLNLLSNAVKFTDEGRVGIDCRIVDPSAGGGMVAIMVSDTGRGIRADQLPRIFDPFVQVGRRLSSSDEGTGLGLAISRDLALGMGGDLSATSAEGSGSVFTLTVPLAIPRGS
jgi:signal transduction histidine kinase